MSDLPLTRSAPLAEMADAAGMDQLFSELGPVLAKSVQVTVTVPHGSGRRTLMDIVVAEADAARAFGIAFRESASTEGFEVTARRFEG